jgi:N-acetylmuramoyl-L-alanine amidase
MANKVIVLDPGHGGKDLGAVGNGLQEKDLNLDVAKKIADFLKPYNVTVHLTRNDDTFIELQQRTEIANKLNADYFLSVHTNAGGGTGFESYIHTSENPGTAELRRVVHNSIIDYLEPQGIINRGSKSANFAVLRLTIMPALLVENLFIDNPSDASKLRDSNFRTGLAKATADGLVKALGLKATEDSPSWDPAAEIENLKKAGLINSSHFPTDYVTWGEFAAVMNRLLAKINK